MIELRKATPSDAALLADTRQKAWSCTYRGIYPDEVIDQFDYNWHTERERVNLAAPSINTWFLMEDGECQGYFTFIIRDEPIWRNYHVRLLSLYLLPRLQGRGLGRTIISQLRNKCRELGYEKMWLSCSPYNTNAMGFYTHLGGRIVREDPEQKNPHEASVEFEFDC